MKKIASSYGFNKKRAVAFPKNKSLIVAVNSMLCIRLFKGCILVKTLSFRHNSYYRRLFKIGKTRSRASYFGAYLASYFGAYLASYFGAYLDSLRPYLASYFGYFSEWIGNRGGHWGLHLCGLVQDPGVLSYVGRAFFWRIIWSLHRVGKRHRNPLDGVSFDRHLSGVSCRDDGNRLCLDVYSRYALSFRHRIHRRHFSNPSFCSCRSRNLYDT